MKIVLAYFGEYQRFFLSKDAFLIPYYISKLRKKNMHIVYSTQLGEEVIPDTYRGVKLINCGHKKYSTLIEFWDSICKIIYRCKSIDTFFFVGLSFVHLLRVWLIKHINPQCNVIAMGDMEPEQALDIKENGLYLQNRIIKPIKKYLSDYFFKNTILLVANPISYEIMCEVYKKNQWKGLLHFYPCLDDETFNHSELTMLPFDKKENIMVCVGRIGCHQKNTEMLLNALKRVDLKDWKIYMIGPITDNFDVTNGSTFDKVVDNFFQEYPKMKDKLVFTGVIYDPKVLFDYYNRAKVLLMTSRHESYGNVYSEAAALGCYIVSTDVGGACFCSNNWEFGIKIEQENSKELADKLNDIVNNKVIVNPQNMIKREKLLYSYLTNEVILPKLI